MDGDWPDGNSVVVYDDGSVRRYETVGQDDWRPKKGERMVRIPNQFDDRQPGVRYQVPRQ